jgi:hypothetical protein
MALQKCPLRVFDSNLTFIAEVDAYEQAYFIRSQSGCGTFEIKINYNANFASIFQKDYFVWFSPDVRRIGIIEDLSKEVDQDGKGSQKITITGKEAKGIFARRLIIPASGNNYYTQNAPIETVIKNAIYDQCGAGASASRQISILTIATDQSRGNTYTIQRFYTNLADDLKSAAEAQNHYMGWYCYLDTVNLKLVLECNPGTDHSASQVTNPVIIFSSNYDTLKKATITDQSSGYKNVVYVGGQGELANKTIIKVHSTTEPTNITRREEYIDESSLQTTTALTNAGTSELASLSAASFSVDAQTLVKSPFVLGTDYDLGDLITIKEYGTSWDVQITEVEESWENNNYEITMTFGKAAQTISSVASSTSTSLDSTQSTKGNLNYKETQKTYDFSSSDHTQALTEVLAETIILTGALTADRTLTLYTDSAGNGTKKYKIVNKCTNSSTNIYKVLITTGISGGINAKFIGVPSLASAYSTYFSGDIICDGTNVYQDSAWTLGYNTNGYWIKHPFGTGTGILVCYFAESTGANNPTWTFPASFAVGSLPYVWGSYRYNGGGAITSSGYLFSCYPAAITNALAVMQKRAQTGSNTGNAGTETASFFAIGFYTE